MTKLVEQMTLPGLDEAVEENPGRGKWPMVKLGDVCEINPRHPKNLDSNMLVSFVPMQSVSEISKSIISEDTRVYSDVSKGYTPFEKGDILLAKITPCFENGKVAIANISHQFGNGSSEFHVFRPKNSKQLDKKFLYYSFQLQNFMDDAAKNMTGSAGQRRVPKSYLESYQIPLPPLSEQHRIVARLDKAQQLIDLRKEQLALMDALVQSLFYEMFGDPVKNEKGWDIRDCGKLGIIQGGLQVTHKRKDLPIEIPYLRVANVFNGYLDLSEIKTIRVTEQEAQRTALLKGDILVVEGHGNPEEVGRCAIWDDSIDNCVHQNHLIRLRLNNEIIQPIYFVAFWNSQGGRKQLASVSKTTSGLNTLSANNIRGLLVPIPPLHLQQAFADRVQQIEALKQSMTASLRELEQNFNALMQEAFGV